MNDDLCCIACICRCAACPRGCAWICEALCRAQKFCRASGSMGTTTSSKSTARFLDTWSHSQPPPCQLAAGRRLTSALALSPGGPKQAAPFFCVKVCILSSGPAMTCYDVTEVPRQRQGMGCEFSRSGVTYRKVPQWRLSHWYRFDPYWPALRPCGTTGSSLNGHSNGGQRCTDLIVRNTFKAPTRREFWTPGYFWELSTHLMNRDVES